MSRTPRGRRRGFTLVELLVVIAIIAVLIGLLLPAVQAAREAARRSACTNNLRQLSVATHLYADTENALPPGAMLPPVRSAQGAGWRVAVLPYLEEQALLDTIALAVDGTMGDQSPASGAPSVMVCPSEPERPADPGSAWSNYAGVAGAGRADDDGRLVNVQENRFGAVHIDGVYFAGSRTRFGQVVDGASSTLALGERAYVVAVAKWTAGGLWRGSEFFKEIRTDAAKNVRAPINADPAVHGHSSADAQRPPGSAATLLQNDLYFGSHHPGGAHFAMVDTSIHFLTDGLDFNLFLNLSTRAGEEATGDAF